MSLNSTREAWTEPIRRRTHFAARDMSLPTAEISWGDLLNGQSYLAAFSGVAEEKRAVGEKTKTLTSAYTACI